MSMIAIVEAWGMVVSLTGALLLFIWRPRHSSLIYRLLLSLLILTSLFHLAEFLEWWGYLVIARWSESLMMLSPVVWGAFFLALGRDLLFARIRSQQEQLALVLAAAPMELALFDADKRYLACTQAYREFHFKDREICIEGQLAGRHEGAFSRLLLDVLTQTAKKQMPQFSEQPVQIEREGKAEWLSWATNSWMKRNGELGGMVLVSQCLTENLQAEKELRELQESLQLDNRMELVGAVAGGIAHDLRNFLYIVRAHFDLIREEDLSLETRRESIADTEKALEASTVLLRSLSDLSARKPRPLQSLNLLELLNSSAGLLRRALPPHLRLEIQTEKRTLWVRADAVKLQQVLLNLVVNARDASPEPGVICMRLRECGDVVELVVSDQGCGMSEEVRRKIFEHQFTTKPVGKGTGLGLSIVKSIVDEHEATIFVESIEGKGTQFTLRFLREPCADD